MTTYRHGLVDVLELIEDARVDVDDSPEAEGQFEEGFEQGYIAALDNMEQWVLELLGIPTSEAH